VASLVMVTLCSSDAAALELYEQSEGVRQLVGVRQRWRFMQYRHRIQGVTPRASSTRRFI
jgi:hypothetical protein